MAIPLFVSGIGTGVGKTLASAILTEALEADYWKPVQTGVAKALNAAEASGEPSEPSDSEWVKAHLSNSVSRVHPECYTLALPASPHTAARQEQVQIELSDIMAAFRALPVTSRYLVVEGAGGLLVPLNDKDFMTDLALAMGAKVILVSRDYLGSINHSLLTARVSRELGLDTAGWIFNGARTGYAAEITHWSGLPALASLPTSGNPDAAFVRSQALQWRQELLKRLEPRDNE